MIFFFFLHFKSFSTHVAHSVKKWCVQFIRHQIYGQKLARSSKTFTNLNLSLLISFYLWSYTHRNTINLWIRHHRDQIFRSAFMSWPLLGGKLWINSPYTHFQQIPADAVPVCFLIQSVMTVSVCFSFSLSKTGMLLILVHEFLIKISSDFVSQQRFNAISLHTSAAIV